MTIQRKGLLAFIVLSLVLILLPHHSFAAKNALEQSYKDVRYTTFIDGNLASHKDQAYLADGGTVYIPIKMFKQIGSIVASGNGFQVKTKLKEQYIDKKDTILYKGTTYISLEKFRAASGYSVKNEENLMVAFLWGDEKGSAKTEKIMKDLSNVPKEQRSDFGEKIYSYKADQVGWIVAMSRSSIITDVTIQFVNGKTIQESIFGSEAPNYCYYYQYERFIWLYQGAERWADKNALPSSNPLYHLEKIKIRSVEIKSHKVIVKATRASGKSVSFQLPLTNDPNDFLDGQFYYTDPREDYPKWSSSIWKAITKQQIQIGMTFNQVLLSWGGPSRTSEYTSALGSIEVWVYGNTYVNFHNGKVHSWSRY
ncbi:hypothetical protein [Paenibacillus sp. MER 99-2]|uniref:hypothetical protein n=1 Tax=Paenibacillus sp. MER 99-2 TaxID=2939572 RepID=UPI0020407802|nr:hypothetical protein [Paenibacillus sp. MER 99-2]MCM3171635.1 hypothetical protein [Paenibacillus sp. MER 99-2]